MCQHWTSGSKSSQSLIIDKLASIAQYLLAALLQAYGISTEASLHQGCFQVTKWIIWASHLRWGHGWKWMLDRVLLFMNTYCFVLKLSINCQLKTRICQNYKLKLRLTLKLKYHWCYQQCSPVLMCACNLLLLKWQETPIICTCDHSNSVDAAWKSSTQTHSQLNSYYSAACCFSLKL